MRADRLDRLEHLDLLVADRLGVEGERRIHGDQREHLEHVVLDDVANGADLLVQLAAAVDADGLGDGDLDPCDRVAVPDPFEERVPETEDEEVLHRLLAHVVIDAEDALLRNDVVKRPVEFLGRLQIVTKRLLDDDRRALDEAGRLDAFDQRCECRGRNREVRDAPIQCARGSERRQISVGRKRDEVQALCERREHVLLQRRPRELFDRRFSEVAKALIVPLRTGAAPMISPFSGNNFWRCRL